MSKVDGEGGGGPIYHSSSVRVTFFCSRIPFSTSIMHMFLLKDARQPNIKDLILLFKNAILVLPSHP